MIRLVTVLVNGEEYLEIDSKWIAEYVKRVLEEIHDIYLGELGKATEIVMLGKPVINLSTDMMKSKTIEKTKKKKKVLSTFT